MFLLQWFKKWLALKRRGIYEKNRLPIIQAILLESRLLFVVEAVDVLGALTNACLPCENHAGGVKSNEELWAGQSVSPLYA